MKKNILGFFSLLLFAGITHAADLEATVIDSDPDASTGEIDLDVNGGISPFVYSWVGPDGFTSLDEDLTGLASGIYTVTVTDQYCGIATLDVTVIEGEIDASSIEEDPIFELSVYPNPTNGLIFIETNQENINIVVFNILGDVIYKGKNKNQIDLTGQPRGIYMIQVSSNNGLLTRKLTLQ